MTLDEAIRYAEEGAEGNQRVVDAGIIAEHLDNYRKRAEEYRQLAEWLTDYKRLKERESCDDKDITPKSLAIAFQFGMAFGFAKKYDEMDKVMEELKKAIIPQPQPCDDCISRQAVNELQKYRYNCGDMTITCVSLKSINELPPVKPQQKMGRWIIINDCELFMAKCSECGEIVDSRMISKYPYCHCGAKMEGEDGGIRWE